MTGRETLNVSSERWVTINNTLAETPPPRDVHEALAALQEVARYFRRRHDNRAIFPEIYGIITEKVATQVLAPRGFFWEPTFITRLAGRFAERYLETLRWSLSHHPQDCGAWSLAYSHNDDAAITPLQHAALGISAHINFDLALGIYRTVVALGAAKSTRLIRRFKHDHDNVNALLAESFPQAIRCLAGRYRCGASSIITRFGFNAASRITLGTLARWRERVWDNVLALLNCRGEVARQLIIRGMDRQSTRKGRILLATRLGGLLAHLPAPLFAQPMPEA